MISQLDILRLAILEDPYDDLPRSAYADQCEEEGLDDVANMIRVSLLYAETCECLNEEGNCEKEFLANCEACEQRHDLHEKLQNLFRPDVTRHFTGNLPRSISRHHILLGQRPTIDFSSLVFWRGFPDMVFCTMEEFETNIRKFATSWPVESIQLTDKIPLETAIYSTSVLSLRGWGWLLEAPLIPLEHKNQLTISAELPTDLFLNLVGGNSANPTTRVYSTNREAMQALKKSLGRLVSSERNSQKALL